MEFNPLSQLRQGNTIWRIRVYVSRLWQHRGGTDTGPIKHTDMVLLDTQGNPIYVEIPEKNVDNFMGRIEEGKIYDIRKFLVFPRKYVFRPVEGHSMIKFTRCTEVIERAGLEAEFPFCTFALTPLAHLPRPTDMPERFTDVLGMVTGISKAVQYVSASRPEPSTKRVIHLKDSTGHQISVVLWGEAALKFEADEFIDLGNSEPVIAIFVGTLVKTYDGQRGVSGSAACRWYINEDLPDIREFRLRLRGNFAPIQHISLPGQTAAEVDAQVNLETKTVRQLVDLDMFDNRDSRFLCTAVLTRLSPSQRWWFSSCTTCHKSTLPDGSAYRCSDSNCSGIDAMPRYRACYVARDDDAEVNDPGEAEFVFFDRVGRELIGAPLISILRHGRSSIAPLQEIIQSARGDLAIPRELAAVVSRKFRFVVSISNKCFTSDDDELSFQVLRIDAPLGHQSRSAALHRPTSVPTGSTSSAALPGDNILSVDQASSNPTGEITDPPVPVIAAAELHTPIPTLPSPSSVTKPAYTGGVAAVTKSKAQRSLFDDASNSSGSDILTKPAVDGLSATVSDDLFAEVLEQANIDPGKNSLSLPDVVVEETNLVPSDGKITEKRPQPSAPVIAPADGKKPRRR